ncbi:MAG: CPBP family intramembrane glutamic endopeptidase [Pseudomonadota bacterium]
MLQWVRDLPGYAEFLIVIFLCFGGTILTSLWIVIDSTPSEPATLLHANYGYLSSAINAVVALFAVALFLSLRGWSLEDFGFAVTWRSTLAALGIILLYYVYYNLLISSGLISWSAAPEASGGQTREISFSLSSVAVSSIIGAVFEETIVVGYVMAFMTRRHGPLLAVGASVGLRVLAGLSQGALAFALVLPMGLLFALIYWRWHNLWPLILAHGLMYFVPWLLLAFV